MKKLELAYTHIQLLNQLVKANYSSSELNFVFDSYQYCVELTHGFQPCGKPFISHLIRTASILVELNQETPVIVAGLLHAIYMSGDFGDGTRRITPWKRARVKERMGETVESYIQTYDALQWKDENIIAVYGRFEQLDTIEKIALLIRLSNELEQSLDLGLLYRSDYEEKIRQIQNRKHILVDMANRLGHLTLANQLEQSLTNTLSAAEEITNLKLRNSEFFSLSSRLSVKSLLIKRVKGEFQKRKISQGYPSVRY
ncbi:MAG: DUF6817 domain-containing protein [Cyanobacteria bacterium P01_D01_bin.50]